VQIPYRHVYNAHLRNVTQVLAAANHAVRYRFASHVPPVYHPIAHIARVCAILGDDSLCQCSYNSNPAADTTSHCHGSSTIRKPTTGNTHFELEFVILSGNSNQILCVFCHTARVFFHRVFSRYTTSLPRGTLPYVIHRMKQAANKSFGSFETDSYHHIPKVTIVGVPKAVENKRLASRQLTQPCQLRVCQSLTFLKI
jgi:hypothetical protein